LQRGWRTVLGRRPPPDADQPWVEQELRRVDFPDARLRPRLVGLAQAFVAQPTAPIPLALHGQASQSKAAYRFFHNPQVDLPTLLHPHYEATAARIAAAPVVLAVQDTTSPNYTAHPATHPLGPINTRADRAQGRKLHDTLALTPQGLPLGLIDTRSGRAIRAPAARPSRASTAPSRPKRARAGCAATSAPPSSSACAPTPGWSTSPTARPISMSCSRPPRSSPTARTC
jgi:hypothetical protein